MSLPSASASATDLSLSISSLSFVDVPSSLSSSTSSFVPISPSQVPTMTRPFDFEDSDAEIDKIVWSLGSNSSVSDLEDEQGQRPSGRHEPEAIPHQQEDVDVALVKPRLSPLQMQMHRMVFTSPENSATPVPHTPKRPPATSPEASRERLANQMRWADEPEIELVRGDAGVRTLSEPRSVAATSPLTGRVPPTPNTPTAERIEALKNSIRILVADVPPEKAKAELEAVQRRRRRNGQKKNASKKQKAKAKAKAAKANDGAPPATPRGAARTKDNGDVVNVSTYPSPAATPKPASQYAKVNKKGKPAPTEAKPSDLPITPPISPKSSKDTKKTPRRKRSTSPATQSSVPSSTTSAPVFPSVLIVSTPTPVKEMQTGLGSRSIVDDESEIGDEEREMQSLRVRANGTRPTAGGVGLLSAAYEEAVGFMNSFMSDPSKFTSRTSRLTFLQALILELGLWDSPKMSNAVALHNSSTSPTFTLPTSLTAATALLKANAFLNIRDYLAVRAQGLDALREVMHASRRGLARSLSGKKGSKRRAPLAWVKESGLGVLLVQCHH